MRWIEKIDQYLDSIELDDSQQRFKVASELCQEAPVQDLAGQVQQFSKAIFLESNTRTYAILFWFALLGPIAAVFYRIVERLLRGDMLDSALSQTKQVIRLVLGVMDWVPVRLSLFTFMLSGSFDEGLQAYRRGTVLATDLFEQNNELLKNVGFHCISAHSVENNSQALEVIRKSRGLILRSLVVWLIMVLIISAIS